MLRWSKYLSEFLSMWGFFAGIGIGTPWIAKLANVVPPDDTLLLFISTLIAASSILLVYLAGVLFAPMAPKRREKWLVGVAIFFVVAAFLPVLGYYSFWRTYVKPCGPNESSVVIASDDGYHQIVKDVAIPRLMKIQGNPPTADDLMANFGRDRTRIWTAESLHRVELWLSALFVASSFLLTAGFCFAVLRETFCSLDGKVPSQANPAPSTVPAEPSAAADRGRM